VGFNELPKPKIRPFATSISVLQEGGPLVGMKTSDHILIILIAGIGDLVLASKSIRAIRNGFPAADIYLLTSTEASAIAKNYGYVDHVWPFPIRELRDAKTYIFEILKLVRKLREIHFDLAINLYRIYSWRGAITMGVLFGVVESATKVGHDKNGFGIFLNKKAPAKIYEDRHFADAMMDIARLAGGVPDDNGIEVFWDEGSEKKWQLLFSEQTSPKKRRIAINPGADSPNKRWNPENYAIVANRLIERFDTEIILLGGPGEENIAQEIQRRISRDVTNLSGQLTLNDLVYVISQCHLLITNDSGPMHVAAALKTPLVAIFGPETPVHTHPYTSPDLYRIAFHEVDCRPCQDPNCNHPLCLELITPEEVLEKCIEMLQMQNLPK
jgi:lipopolysaccharide heptosyltransferase II